MALNDLLSGGLSSQVEEASKVLGKGKESVAQKSFNRDFNTGDFDSFGGDVESGKFNEIARFQIPASTEYSWGYGSAENPQNQGYLYVDLQNSTPSAIEGTIRFELESATGRNSQVVADFDTTRLDASKTDKQLMVPFPEQVSHPKVEKDQHLAIYLDADSTDTVDSGQSEVIVPVTEYDLGDQR